MLQSSTCKMDMKSTKSSCSKSDISQTSSLSSKIKRLKIEESLLLQSINKCVPEDSEGNINATSYQIISEFKTFSAKTKHTYREIKLIFQDIKTSTSSVDMLKAIDIEDIKRNTLELENRIKVFKTYLQSELTSLRSAEEKLNQSLNENPVCISNLKRQPRIHTAKYNEIVPSPVKTMMTSPFKCQEVQQFQDFMMNSSNRYGGWNEYYHNIFVNLWHKHFGSQVYSSYDGEETTVEKSPAFNSFLDELFPKLKGIDEADILSHIKWYSKYIYLKDRQQKAIDKWRNNRKVMKLVKVASEVKKNNNRGHSGKVSDELSNTNESTSTNHTWRCPMERTSSNVHNFIRACLSKEVQQVYSSEYVYGNLMIEQNQDCEKIADQPSLHYQKSTAQWNNRIYGKNVEKDAVNLENIQKLGIPIWRAGL